MNHLSTEKSSSDRSLKIKLYMTILIVLASIAGMFFIGNLGLGILSSLRAFVDAEASYSMHSQAAAFHLVRYAQTLSEESFQGFMEPMTSSRGHKTTRRELKKLHPDLSVVYEGLEKGGSHREDFAGMVFIFKT